MASKMDATARCVGAAFEPGAPGGLADGELLGRFIARGEEAVFGAIVRRHGPMVWGVCRRTLRDHHDAEDAFQATFLVLARRASAVTVREQLGPWLYGVACRTARRARATMLKREAKRGPLVDLPDPRADTATDDRLDHLDREIGRLPARYRTPIVLCELEGLTHREAADRLGWPIGTVSGRLSRGRALLARRLMRGQAPPQGGMLAGLLACEAMRVPMALGRATVRAACLMVTGTAGTEVASTRVLALTKGVLDMMFWKKVGMAALVLVALAGLTAAGSLRADRDQPAGATNAPANVTRDAPVPGKDIDEKAARQQVRELQERERGRLEGTWAITQFVVEGASYSEMEEEHGRFDIKGDKIRVRSTISGADAWSFSVDPGKTPGRIALIPLDEKTGEEVMSHAIRLGIYKLEDDTLTICDGLDYPDRFESPPNSTRVLVVLKRAKW